jgi:hypothetical protein
MNRKFVAVSVVVLQCVLASIATGATKEINFGWPSGEGWSSQPYKVAQFHAEKQGLKTLVSAKELGELIRIPITGVNVTHKKLEKDGDEIVRVLRALCSALVVLQEQQSYGVGLFENAMRLDRSGAERLYGLVRDQYNPDLTLPDAVVNDLLGVGTFRAKEKPTVNLSAVRDWSFAEKAKR